MDRKLLTAAFSAAKNLAQLADQLNENLLILQIQLRSNRATEKGKGVDDAAMLVAKAQSVWILTQALVQIATFEQTFPNAFTQARVYDQLYPKLNVE